ncbi:hypothetical protein Trydic_g9953 [Trypoxylus dichotomus]
MPMELARNSPIVTLEAITRLFPSGLQSCEFPEEWKIGRVSFIPRKGSMESEIYRGISVTSSIYKLYGRIVKPRVEEQLKDSEQLTGSRPGRSLKKTYDNVPMNQLWQAMKDNGVQTM